MKTGTQVLRLIVLILAVLLLVLFLALDCFDLTFSPERAVEDLYRDAVIEADRYRFYLWTDDTGCVIGAAKAVKRYGFLWKAVEGETTELYVNGQEAGTLFCFENGDTTHCFIRWTVTKSEPGKDHYAFRTDTVQVNGKDVALDRFSYFTVNEPIAQMAFERQAVSFN